jgi:hypothetical protein
VAAAVDAAHEVLQPIELPLLFFKLPYYCCIGYIVTFTKVLTMYHSLIHPLQYYPLSPLPIPVTVKRSHFSIFIH